ncbi:MAG: hypothetical protein ACLTSZ_03405 [Lachnospiraceae bacterium]
MALLLAGITAFGMTAVPAFAEGADGDRSGYAERPSKRQEVYNVLLISVQTAEMTAGMAIRTS